MTPSRVDVLSPWARHSSARRKAQCTGVCRARRRFSVGGDAFEPIVMKRPPGNQAAFSRFGKTKNKNENQSRFAVGLWVVVSDQLKNVVFSSLVGRPTVAVAKDSAIAESRETDRSTDCSGRRRYSFQGYCGLRIAAPRSDGNHDPSRRHWPSAVDNRAGASGALVGLLPSAGSGDWRRVAVAAVLPVGTLDRSSIAHGRNSRRRRRQPHRHDSGAFGEQSRT